MNFEPAPLAAQRLNVSLRSIQKWAKEGRIPGAEKHSRTWLIPLGFSTPLELPSTSYRIPMPLLNSTFEIGKCKEFIHTLPDEDDRRIAQAEYYYFSGQAEAAERLVEPYMNSPDPSLRLSAGLISLFANLSRGHIHLARFAMNVVKDQMIAGLQAKDSQLHAMSVLIANTALVLLHLPANDVPPLEDYLLALPGGLKLWACYVLSHKAYLEKNYERSLAMADLALSLCPHTFPIAAIYCHLAACMDLMNLMRPEDAKKRIAAAWELAQQDGFIEPFGEHHGLLQGLIEIFFKNSPDNFDRIIAITYTYSAGWRSIHNSVTKHEVADNLTTTEFTVAMLYNRGWTAKEIAAHMEMNPRSVTNMVQVIYQKLGISSKRELGQYMLI